MKSVITVNSMLCGVKRLSTNKRFLSTTLTWNNNSSNYSNSVDSIYLPHVARSPISYAMTLYERTCNYLNKCIGDRVSSMNTSASASLQEDVEEVGTVTNSALQEPSIYLSSTRKKRRSKMNKHKLKKRRKLLRMNTKQSRA